ncbi:MAG: hypothetical protein AAFQ82_11505, partial [Myxococcota bacterium]
KSYVLGYGEENDSQRSILTSLTAEAPGGGSSPLRLPSTRFGYTEGPTLSGFEASLDQETYQFPFDSRKNFTGHLKTSGSAPLSEISGAPTLLRTEGSFADWNGDGFVDMLIAEARTLGYRLHAGSRSGGFESTPQNWPGQATRPGDLVIDVNSDGLPDLFMPHVLKAVQINTGGGFVAGNWDFASLGSSLTGRTPNFSDLCDEDDLRSAWSKVDHWIGVSQTAAFPVLPTIESASLGISRSFSVVAYHDINGDALPDFIFWDGVANSDYDRWLVFHGTLNGPNSGGFDGPKEHLVPANYDHVSCRIPQTPSSRIAWTVDGESQVESTVLADLNGDGLDDLPPYLNSGSSGVLFVRADGWNTSVQLGEDESYQDVNNDGLSDIVRVTEDDGVYVRLNFGNHRTNRPSAFDDEIYIADVPEVEAVDFMDIDHDGLVELVAFDWVDVSSTRRDVEARVLGTFNTTDPAPSLLVSHDNGIGGLHSYSYAPSKTLENVHVPGSFPVVVGTASSVFTPDSDGRSALAPTHYAYWGGGLQYSPDEGRFIGLGFDVIEKTIPGLRTEYARYRMSPDAAGGQLQRTLVLNANGCPMTDSSQDWQIHNPANAPEIAIPYAERTVVRTHEQGNQDCTVNSSAQAFPPSWDSYSPAPLGTVERSKRTVEVDDLGRYVLTIDEGDPADPSDDVQTTREYASDVGANPGALLPGDPGAIVQRFARILRHRANGSGSLNELESDVRYFYDGVLSNPYDASPFGELDGRGLLKFVETCGVQQGSTQCSTNMALGWLNVRGPRYAYGDWGRKIMEVEPIDTCEGNTTTYEYDSDWRFPTVETTGIASVNPNRSQCGASHASMARSSRSSFRPDGSLEWAQDVNGNTTEFEYDGLGRKTGAYRVVEGNRQLMKSWTYDEGSQFTRVHEVDYDDPQSAVTSLSSIRIFDGLGRELYQERQLGADYENYKV